MNSLILFGNFSNTLIHGNKIIHTNIKKWKILILLNFFYSLTISVILMEVDKCGNLG